MMNASTTGVDRSPYLPVEELLKIAKAEGHDDKALKALDHYVRNSSDGRAIVLSQLDTGGMGIRFDEMAVAALKAWGLNLEKVDKLVKDFAVAGGAGINNVVALRTLFKQLGVQATPFVTVHGAPLYHPSAYSSILDANVGQQHLYATGRPIGTDQHLAAFKANESASLRNESQAPALASTTDVAPDASVPVTGRQFVVDTAADVTPTAVVDSASGATAAPSPVGGAAPDVNDTGMLRMRSLNDAVATPAAAKWSLNRGALLSRLDSIPMPAQLVSAGSSGARGAAAKAAGAAALAGGVLFGVTDMAVAGTGAQLPVDTVLAAGMVGGGALVYRAGGKPVGAGLMAVGALTGLWALSAVPGKG